MQKLNLLDKVIMFFIKYGDIVVASFVAIVVGLAIIYTVLAIIDRIQRNRRIKEKHAEIIKLQEYQKWKEEFENSLRKINKDFE